MIQTYTWEIDPPLGASKMGTVDQVLRAGNGIMAYTSFLKGVDASFDDERQKLIVSIRVHGKDRWAAQAHAKQLGEKVLKASRLWTSEITHVSTTTEPNRRGLKDGEGRTPRPRPQRASEPGRSS